MLIRQAEAEWNGSFTKGSGTMSAESGAVKGVPYSVSTRFGEEKGSNPDELLGAAHAGCFSMAFALLLENAGFSVKKIRTSAAVHVEKKGDGFEITQIDLETIGQVEGIEERAFLDMAQTAKKGCPVSKALAATPITLKARLMES